MAEKSFGFNSAGPAPGDRAYSASDYMSWQNVHAGGNSGVVTSYLNQLAVTSLGAYSISINTGGAVYNGYTYSNDSTLTKVLDSVDTTYKRYDRVVVRFDASVARSALVTIITGTPSTGTPSIPSLGVSDIALATVYIDNTSGTPSFTVTDNRSYKALPLAPSNVATASVADLAITEAKLASSSVSNGKIADNSVTTSKIADDSVTGAKVAANTLTSSAMAVFYKIRSTIGGSISGSFTLPQPAVGETYTFFYNVIGSSTVLAPSGSYAYYLYDQATLTSKAGLATGPQTIFSPGVSPLLYIQYYRIS